MSQLIVAIDFDGTCCTHEYPKVGEDIGAWPVIQELHECNVLLILFTMRSGRELDAAIAEFAKRGIPLFGVNRNPRQGEWTTSPKPYAHLYIDDAALGAPLFYTGSSERPYVDWRAVRVLLKQRGFLQAQSPLAIEAQHTITIPKTVYFAMKESAEMLQCLRNAGVENWEGWNVAVGDEE